LLRPAVFSHRPPRLDIAGRGGAGRRIQDHLAAGATQRKTGFSPMGRDHSPPLSGLVDTVTVSASPGVSGMRSAFSTLRPSAGRARVESLVACQAAMMTGSPAFSGVNS